MTNPTITARNAAVETIIRQRLREFGMRFDGDVEDFLDLYTPDVVHCAPTREPS